MKTFAYYIDPLVCGNSINYFVCIYLPFKRKKENKNTKQFY